MSRTIRFEVFKLRRRPGVWVLGLLLLAILLLGYILIWHFISNPPKGARFERGFNREAALVAVYPQSFIRTTFSTAGQLGGALCMVLGVLSVGSEYGWGTLKTSLIQGPGRLQLYAGKLVGLALVVLVFVVAMFGVAAAVSALLVHVDGKTSAWPDALDILKGVGAAWLVFGMWTSFGTLLAYLFRQATLAIGIGLVYMLILEAIIGGILVSIGGDVLLNTDRLLPGTNVTGLISSFGSAPRFLGGGGAALVDGQRGLTTLGVYLAVFVVIAGASFLRRDITLGR